MGRTLKNNAITVFVLLGVAMVGMVSTNAAARTPDGHAAVATFLGYEIGEERRYIIAPDDAMREGESANWSVRLNRVETDKGRSIGVFRLTHVESRWSLNPFRVLVEWHYIGEARINEFGFPEAVRFSMYEEHIGENPWRGVLMSAEYKLEGDEYIKTVRVPDQVWEFRFGIATHDDLDLNVPAGMFLFRPQSTGVDFFMNPALLGFSVPEVLPDTWKHRVLFFRPTYPVRYPGARYVARERNRVAAIRRYYDKRTLEAKESSELKVGGRTLNVRKIDVTGPVRDVFVDEFGRVVRIDLDRDPITRKDRYIRLLFPSEY